MLRRFLCELADERLKRGVGLRMRDAGLQSNARIEALHLVAGDLQRQVDIAIAPGESRAGNADDGVVLADQLDGFADD